MSENPESLLETVNTSGYPFQIGVQAMIENTRGEHHWKIIGAEHRWQNNLSGREGFIDIVVGQDGGYPLRMAIECKRVKGDAHWIFLVSRSRNHKFQRVNGLWTATRGHTDSTLQYMDWGELFFEPLSPESSFCVVRGQNPNDKIMIERLADGLLPSLESLAFQELSLIASAQTSRIKIYVPMIVTNATLTTCDIDSDNIDLQSGELQLSEVKFEAVPYIRFRKGLTTTVPPIKAPSSLEQANTEGQRTLFVVNIQYLREFLNRFAEKVGVAVPPWESFK